MTSQEERKWERLRQVLAAGAVGAEVKPVVSQRTLFGIKSSVEEQIERIVAEDEARRRFAARKP